MRNRFVVSGFVIVLVITCAAWALQPTAAGGVVSVPPETANSAILTGRVTSVHASGQSITIETTNGSTVFNAVTPGDPVEVLRSSNSPLADEIATPSGDVTHRRTANADGTRPVNIAPSRRLLGVWLLAMSGTVVMLRARRPLTP